MSPAIKKKIDAHSAAEPLAPELQRRIERVALRLASKTFGGRWVTTAKDGATSA